MMFVFELVFVFEIPFVPWLEFVCRYEKSGQDLGLMGKKSGEAWVSVTLIEIVFVSTFDCQGVPAMLLVFFGARPAMSAVVAFAIPGQAENVNVLETDAGMALQEVHQGCSEDCENLSCGE